MLLRKLIVPGVVGTMALALSVAAHAEITVSDSGKGTASAYAETQLTGFPGYTPISLVGSPVDNGFHNAIVNLTPGVYLFQYWGSGDSVFDNLFTINPDPDYSVTQGTGAINSIGPGGTGGYGAPFQLTVTANTALDFTFSTSGPPGCSVSPGGSIVDCDYIAATLGYVPGGGTQSASVAYLGFSDRNEVLDHDHQDLTIRISEVPEPVSMLLLGTGLLGLAAARRRKAG